MDEKPEFSHIVQVCALGSSPLELDLSATAEQRVALAKRMNVDGLEDFQAHVSLILLKNSDVDMTATFSAKVRQPCVITTKPVISDLKATFSMTYSKVIEDDEEEDDEDFDDFESQYDPPEPLIDGQIDVGETLTEQLALEIPPFPRVKGAVFDGFETVSKTLSKEVFEKKNPFAVLSQLKEKPKNKENKK